VDVPAVVDEALSREQDEVESLSQIGIELSDLQRINRRAGESLLSQTFVEEPWIDLISRAAALVQATRMALGGPALGADELREEILDRATRLEQQGGTDREIDTRLIGRNAERLEGAVAAVSELYGERPAGDRLEDLLLETAADSAVMVAERGP
jgi:hypothetical protein